MTVIQASDEEQTLFDEFLNEQPELIDLASLVAFAPRIEPPLLRGIRLRYLPRLNAMVEHRLWFSELVFTRTGQSFIFSPGMTRLLTTRITQVPVSIDLESLRAEHQRLTQHWKPMDRLERDLYFFAHSGNEKGVAEVFQDLLRLIAAYSDNPDRHRSDMLDISRRIKYTSPIINDMIESDNTIKQMIYFAAANLNDPGSWSDRVDPVALPEWLASTLVDQSGDRLAVELRHDASSGNYMLYFPPPQNSENSIEFSGQLPERLHIKAKGYGAHWVLVNAESKIKLPDSSTHIELTTRRGKHYHLNRQKIHSNSDSQTDQPQAESPIYLAHSKHDERLAEQMQQWLKTQDIDVALIEEKPGKTAQDATDPDIRVIRLWTEGMQKQWLELDENELIATQSSLLLQADNIAPPNGFTTPGQVIDVRNWKRDTTQQLARETAARIGYWAMGYEGEPNLGPAPDQYDEERAVLLAEIENPDTKPERRLEIGDRLDEIGDPRPGVGTIEIEVPGPDPQAQTRTSPVDELLAELDNPETQPERRLKIGDELNDMPGGDPRFGVGLNADSWPEIDWVNIPAGEFIYGKDSDEEKRYLDAFEIARYPVTNAQYQAFVDDKGYDDERWWTGLEKPQKEPSEWPQGNRPKTNVDWYEATAFTRWLSYRLGYSVTLPHETQWERAARGQQGRVYPWGAEYLSGYANVNEKRNKDGAYFLEQTTAIGVYRHASTQEGVLDTSGNVWEWCRNDFDKPDEEVEVPSLPVMRGGGWYFNPDFARAALRSLNLPDSRSYNFGFRLLRSPPS